MKIEMILILVLISMINVGCWNSTDKSSDVFAGKEEISNHDLSDLETEKQTTLVEEEVIEIEVKLEEGSTTKGNEQATDESKILKDDAANVKKKVEKKVKGDTKPSVIVDVQEDLNSKSQNPEKATEVQQIEIDESKEVVEIQEENLEVSEEKKIAVVAKPDHSTFNTLLGRFVDGSGNVNYSSLKKSESDLDAYLKNLSDNPIESSWSKNEKLAYWINAYNAFTLKLILKNYPLKSIIDLHGGKPWDQKWIQLGGKTYSLNQIENDIIRPQFKDARIHFAVNCAAKSCPPIANKAFTADNLNSLLDKQAKSFINNSKYNQISANKAQVSKIFEWYGVDFGDLPTFLNKYSTTALKSGASIGFTEYDWALNDK